MIILKPTKAVTQNPEIEEYHIEVKNGIEYFYKYCPVCEQETSWCPVQSCCEQCGSQ